MAEIEVAPAELREQTVPTDADADADAEPLTQLQVRTSYALRTMSSSSRNVELPRNDGTRTASAMQCRH
jgi:hypothetical protein